MTSTIEHN